MLHWREANYMKRLPVCGADRDDGLIVVQLQGSEIGHDHQNTPINVIRTLQTVSNRASLLTESKSLGRGDKP